MHYVLIGSVYCIDPVDRRASFYVMRNWSLYNTTKHEYVLLDIIYRIGGVMFNALASSVGYRRFETVIRANDRLLIGYLQLIR